MVTSTKVSRSSTANRPVNSTFAKKPAKPSKPNASILSFFQKAPKPEDSLFVASGATATASTWAPTSIAEGHDTYGGDDEVRFNESDLPNKKRKTDEERSSEAANRESVSDIAPTTTVMGIVKAKTPRPKPKTPFVVDSDSEDEEPSEMRETSASKTVDYHPQKEAEEPSPAAVQAADAQSDQDADIKYEPPPIKKQESSSTQIKELEDFADLEGFDLDEFEGEELQEMRFMRESDGFGNDDEDTFDDPSPIDTCPICNGSLTGLSAHELTQHVNNCLDGDGDGDIVPLPADDGDFGAKNAPVIELDQIGKRLSRAAVPRPAQANPLDVGILPKEKGTASAFSKLMSGNAEDSAWASAAASEHASRGRPAYERTCPFYKIMPGFSICVDAFRYGAVEGCKAYFLSHFHSDHYIGLTANWSHGPIYCSKVTGSLVRNQLRTAAKWVVELEFEKPYDIPGTQGASVTMIPANHCPGSSLFLFEKAFGAGQTLKTKRILHCGDFRACPEHVGHPLLKPDVAEPLTGRLRAQRIDLCYLDTTYLNPRYSFPPQGDVIKACAELCGTMSADPTCKDGIGSGSILPKTETMGQYLQQSTARSPDKDEDKDKDNPGPQRTRPAKQRLLVVCGTYSIGKERICVAIAKRLKSKIFASPAKIRICKQLGDAELTSLLTADPTEAQVHMQMLMEIRAETLQDYLNGYKPHFSRIVGFRPSGWNFRQAGGSGSGSGISANAAPSSLQTDKILHAPAWRTRFEMRHLAAQRGSTSEAMCFGVPYSEHSSFRELAMFVLSLRIDKIVPTVNVGSAQSRKRMKGWIDKWMMERGKRGLLKPLVEGQDEGEDDVRCLWGNGKAGTGGGAWW